MAALIPPPGPHGGDGPRLAAALGIDPCDVLDLSQSLNPFAPDVATLAWRHLGELRRYPDPSAATGALAAALGTDADRVLLTNGGSEAIALVAQHAGGGVLAEPEFALHPRGDGPRWRSDPHNPTGLLAVDGDNADVWDEAFYPLATGRWTAPGRPAVVGSLTKVFACPGLRIGYVLADDAQAIRRHQPEWAVNALAAALVPNLLARADLAGWAVRIAAQRRSLVDALARAGLRPQPSDAPWVLVKAPGLRERLAPQGVVVRDCTSFGLPGHVRIAVPDDRGLERLAAALEATA